MGYKSFIIHCKVLPPLNPFKQSLHSLTCCILHPKLTKWRKNLLDFQQFTLHCTGNCIHFHPEDKIWKFPVDLLSNDPEFTRTKRTNSLKQRSDSKQMIHSSDQSNVPDFYTLSMIKLFGNPSLHSSSTQPQSLYRAFSHDIMSTMLVSQTSAMEVWLFLCRSFLLLPYICIAATEPHEWTRSIPVTLSSRTPKSIKRTSELVAPIFCHLIWLSIRYGKINVC